MSSELKTMTSLSGLATARGFAMGPVFVLNSGGEMPVPEYVIEPGREPEELLRLHRAIRETKRDLENLISVLKERTGKDDIRVFECHQMILEDEVLTGEIHRRIERDRVNAEAAVRATMNGARAQFERMNDPYFRERVRDFDDLERRLLTVLTGYDRQPHLELKTPSIVVADELTPSETVQLPRELVLGFATNKGSTTSHAALLARALAIPAVCGLGDITARVKPGETVLLDGTNGAITLSPDRETVAQFEQLIRRDRELNSADDTLAKAGTLADGGSVGILANVHPGIPLGPIVEHGASGIGLYRSEFLWLGRELEPTEDEQYAEYRKAALFAARIRESTGVTIRTLDLGGDKMMKGMAGEKEANPFLGNRSIRYFLSHREVMRTQLRAILRASAETKNVHILLPMVSCIEELIDVKDEIAAVKKALDEEGIGYDPAIKVGIMVEVPSAALNAASFAEKVDFFSIGTNDLVQYTMAADRGNEAVAHLYQPLNQAVIRLVRMTVEAAKEKGIPVGVCGESASDPVTGVYWAALGVDDLSMSSTFIPLMARILAKLTRADLDEYAKVPFSLGRTATEFEIREACRRWLVGKVPEFEDVIV